MKTIFKYLQYFLVGLQKLKRSDLKLVSRGSVHGIICYLRFYDENFVSFIKAPVSISHLSLCRSLCWLNTGRDRQTSILTWKLFRVINSHFMQIKRVKQKYPPKPLEFPPLKRHERQRRDEVNKRDSAWIVLLPQSWSHDIQVTGDHSGSKHRQ